MLGGRSSLVFTVSALCLLLVVIPPPNRHHWRSHKRRATANSTSTRDAIEEPIENTIAELTSRLDAAYNPGLPADCFLMEDSDKTELISWLWACDYTQCTCEILEANPDLEHMLSERTMNTYSSRLSDTDYSTHRRPRLNFLAGMLARNCNTNAMPQYHVLMGIDAKQKDVNREFWDKMTRAGALPSYNWIDQLVTQALESCLCLDSHPDSLPGIQTTLHLNSAYSRNFVKFRYRHRRQRNFYK